MDWWRIKAAVYGLRGLPLIRRILNRETQGLAALLERAGIQPGVVLDAGSGIGSSLDVFRGSGTIIAMDRCYGMVRRIRCRNTAGLVGDALHFPVRGGSVPFVSAVGLVEYLREPSVFLDEVRRVLENGGYLLVTIAPPGFLNRMRIFTGHRVFLIRPDAWEERMRVHGFIPVGRSHTPMQVQYLCRISP